MTGAPAARFGVYAYPWELLDGDPTAKVREESLPAPDTLTGHLRTLAGLGIADVGFYNSSLAASDAMAALRRALAEQFPSCRPQSPY